MARQIASGVNEVTPAPAPVVNAKGTPLELAAREVTATISVLSEDTTFCSVCGGLIIEKCVYLTKPKRSREQFELVAIVHPECYGAAGRSS
ncbi:MAG: hypothetical protein M3Q49_04995 [Actinomycetota bacterium]|nr:hypothetical protein [Actinomycetota bacterium]MDP9485141.1 hypothetical protein [Actinomycetota bacterium]PLS81223.1 MAG: hypothetical protein CYG60_26045 [Actinomycetota bacterium]